MMNIDIDTGVPVEFWHLIKKFGNDAVAFSDVLGQMDRGQLELNFLIYVQLRADLAYVLLSSQENCSEDAAEDIADGLIAQGRESFLAAMREGVIPARNEWPAVEQSRLLHEFDAIYWDRFGGAIWDITDALENEKLPWEI